VLPPGCFAHARGPLWASRFYFKQTRGPQLLPDVEVEVEFHTCLLGVDRVGDFHFDQIDIELPCRTASPLQEQEQILEETRLTEAQPDAHSPFAG
jgi:hypothetical protein